MLCRIAGLLVDVTCSGRTASQAEAYLASAWDRPADIRIEVDTAGVLARHPELETLDIAEYMVTGECFARELLSYQGLMLHASAIEYRGRAVCFSAPSGVGKSTLTQRWARLFGAAILNDDKPALRRMADGWQVYGTPWSGKEDRSINRSAPLEAVCFLFRGEENAAAPLTPAQALPLLLSQTMYRLRAEDLDRLLELADRLLRETPLWRLTCRNDDSAAYFSRSVLFP